MVFYQGKRPSKKRKGLQLLSKMYLYQICSFAFLIGEQMHATQTAKLKNNFISQLQETSSSFVSAWKGVVLHSLTNTQIVGLCRWQFFPVTLYASKTANVQMVLEYQAVIKLLKFTDVAFCMKSSSVLSELISLTDQSCMK